MKKLFQIVAEKEELKTKLFQIWEEYKKAYDSIKTEIQKLEHLEASWTIGLDVERIQIAEKLLDVRWNPYGITGDYVVAEDAIIDIANWCQKLKEKFFWNKQYDWFYQRCDCSYGYWPKHGSIVDRIWLKDIKHEMTDDEKDACIYYLKNYKIISSSKSHA